MAGNPFRRAQPYQVTSLSTSIPGTASPYEQLPTEAPQAADHNVTPTRPRSESKAKKTVRIRSPEFSPISPDYIRTAPLPDYRTAVPPPPPAAFRSASPVSSETSEETSTDHFDTRFPPAHSVEPEGDADELLRNTRSNSGNAEVKEEGKHNVPDNPFSRTLASMEAGIASIVPQPQEKFKLAKLDDAVPEKGDKPAMDVDSFTRMLMTGKVDGPKAQIRILNQGPAVDSNSSTDMSSISRHSVFDSAHGQSLESPRTSYDLSVADEQDYDGGYNDSEQASLVRDTGESASNKGKKAPPPPKHRHGKSVARTGPQTVAFDDFTASLMENLPKPAPDSTQTDLNKPLPSLPEFGSTEAAAPVELEREKTPTPATVIKEPDAAAVPSRSVSQKKAPPPVPLARRQSQLASKGQNRSRSSSVLTTGSQEGGSYPSSIAESVGSSKLPPPLPPTRRHGNTSALPTTDVNSAYAHRGGLAQVATSSQYSSQSNLSSPPPPPPPRRRRSSGRNSLDQASNSGDLGRGSFDSRRMSNESTSVLASPMEETSHRDVLADLDAFQREIDELRKAQN